MSVLAVVITLMLVRIAMVLMLMLVMIAGSMLVLVLVLSVTVVLMLELIVMLLFVLMVIGGAINSRGVDGACRDGDGGTGGGEFRLYGAEGRAAAWGVRLRV